MTPYMKMTVDCVLDMWYPIFTMVDGLGMNHMKTQPHLTAHEKDNENDR